MLEIPKTDYTSWQQLVSDYRSDFRPEDQWVFRGHEDANWHLLTTLERQLAKYDISVEHASNYEQQILRDFLRKIGNYEPAFAPGDALECLSYIQHYGGPTRLLDWTYSFYVAAFFALAPAAPRSKAAIFCFKTGAWDANAAKPALFGEKALRAIGEDGSIKNPATHELMFGLPQLLADSISKAPPQLDAQPCVFQLNSRFLNSRIAQQQGVFLVQTVVSQKYEDNLDAMLALPSFKGSMRKLVIECSPELLKEALLDLRRMTITYEALFQGVDYFCRSLALGILDRYNLLTDTEGIQLLRDRSPT